MFKLNNNGFAVSTILYGLLIVLILIMTLIMSTMSFTRKNSKEFTDTVIEQLEKNKSTDNDNKIVCTTKAKSYSIKQPTCDDIYENLKQDFFSICYRTSNDNNEQYCNQKLYDHSDDMFKIYQDCQSDSTKENILRKSCCYSKTQGATVKYNECMS